MIAFRVMNAAVWFGSGVYTAVQPVPPCERAPRAIRTGATPCARSLSTLVLSVCASGMFIAVFMPAMGLAAVGNSAWIASGSSSEGTPRNVALLWEAAHVAHTFVWPCLVGYIGLHAIEVLVLQPTTHELDQTRMRLAAIQKECKQLKEEALELQTRADVGATIEETVRIRPRRRRAYALTTLVRTHRRRPHT